jgi:hypothetical protein
MWASKTTMTVDKDEGLDESGFGLHVYSHFTKDQLADILNCQQPFVDDNTLLFFLRTLDSVGNDNGDFVMVTWRVMKDKKSAQKMQEVVAPIITNGIESGMGGVDFEIIELTYDDFVDLQTQSGTKYYFAGLADVLDEYE